MVYIENAVDAHLLAEAELNEEPPRPKILPTGPPAGPTSSRTSEPVTTVGMINSLLVALGELPIKETRLIRVASALGSVRETIWGARSHSSASPP